MPAPKEDGPTSVYIIACDGCVKIGISNDPERRLQDMRTAMPGRPTLLATREFACRLHARRAESEVHWTLARFRVRARGEWFRVHPAHAKAMLTKVQIPEIMKDWR